MLLWWKLFKIYPMALYRYVKRPPVVKVSPPRPALRIKLNPQLAAGFLVTAGLLLFINAVYPIVAYQLFVSPRFSPSFVSPTTESAIDQSFGSPRNSAVLGAGINLVDYTQPVNWSAEAKEKTEPLEKLETGTYLLSIPKLKINNAKVVVGLDDLKQSLVQYPGTAPPGKFGNTVIFGHSVLPQFFSPTNYSTIFSTLPTLRQGDEIFVEYNAVKYRFVVEQMLEVWPNDISILAQRYDDSYLTLITCVPPGTFLKRLIVRARLAKI